MWPLLNDTTRHVPHGSRGFAASRGGGDRKHAGVDLDARFGDVVVTPEPGEVVSVFAWPSRAQPSGRAVMIQSDAGPVFLLAPIDPNTLEVRKGERLEAGETIGTIGKYPRGSSMLHFEMYEPGTRTNRRWYAGKTQPRALLDPGAYLRGEEPILATETELEPPRLSVMTVADDPPPIMNEPRRVTIDEPFQVTGRRPPRRVTIDEPFQVTGRPRLPPSIPEPPPIMEVPGPVPAIPEPPPGAFYPPQRGDVVRSLPPATPEPQPAMTLPDAPTPLPVSGVQGIPLVLVALAFLWGMK